MSMSPITPVWPGYVPYDPNSEEGKEIARQQRERQDWIASAVFGKPIANFLKSTVEQFFASSTGKKIGEGFVNVINTMADGLEQVFPSGKAPLNSIYDDVNFSDTSSAKPIVYSEWSPASKLFGMNQETAFSEHLANTAHQREVADLKAAGLNPVLGISGSGSSVVSGNSAVGSSSAQKADGNMFLDLLGATSAVITAVATKNPMYGYLVANIFKSFD